jgi:hypothetical protein
MTRSVTEDENGEKTQLDPVIANRALQIGLANRAMQSNWGGLV